MPIRPKKIIGTSNVQDVNALIILFVQKVVFRPNTNGPKRQWRVFQEVEGWLPTNQQLLDPAKKVGFEEKSLGSTVFHQFFVEIPHDSARNFLKTLYLLQLLEFLQVKVKIFCIVFLRLSCGQCCFIQPQWDNAAHTNIQ